MKATPEPAASSTPRIFIGLTFSLHTRTGPQKRQRRKGKGEQAEAHPMKIAQMTKVMAG